MSNAPLLTVPEVADRLNLNFQHVWRMVNAGKIPSYRIGRSRRVSQDDLDAYLEACRVPAPRSRT